MVNVHEHESTHTVTRLLSKMGSGREFVDICLFVVEIAPSAKMCPSQQFSIGTLA